MRRPFSASMDRSGTCLGAHVEVFILFLVLVLAIAALLTAKRAAARARHSDERWSDAMTRIYALEQQLRRLNAPPAPPEARGPQTRQVPAAVTPLSVEVPKAVVTAAVEVPPPISPAAGSVPCEPAPAAGAARPPSLPIRVAPERIPAPTFTMLEPTPLSSFSGTAAPADSSGRALSIEEMLGANWLNKLGVIILVMGVALFLAYQLKTLGPAGKVVVGYLAGATLLAAGLWFEKREAYRLLARAGVGGGWALLYFTTYAMHHVEAARIISSQAVDLVLLLMVAAAMVVHTLRYHSQVVTGLAFLLGGATVTISHVNVYSLLAGAILAAALVVIVQKRGWFELEVFGILATYLNHWFWLRPIIEPMGGHHHSFAEFPASAALLLFYWVIFRGSYVGRRIASTRQENVSTIAALLNTFLLLAVMKYQAIHPEWAFWCLLSLGAVEVALARLPLLRRRRTAFVILSTLGVALLVAAFPFRYSGYRLSILWLVEAETFFLAGVLTREILFRCLGMLAGLVVACQMLGVDAAEVYGARMDGARNVPEIQLGILFGLAAAIFYANAHWVYRRWSAVATTAFEALCSRRLSYIAGVMALVAAWLTCPGAWTVVAWSALALGLIVVGNRYQIRTLAYQAHVLAALVLLRVLIINIYSVSTYHHLTLRLISLSAVAVFFYLCSRWKGSAAALAQQRLPAAYSWAASSLVALLMWYELRPAGVALGWALLGLLLFEWGQARASFSLRLQGYVVLTSAFLRLFFVNLNASGNPGELSPRVYTVVPLVLAFYYVYARLEGATAQVFERDRRCRAPAVSSYFGTIALAALMRFELGLDWVIVAWATLVLALVAVAWKTARPLFLHQGHFGCFAVLFRAIFHNFYERSYFAADFWHGRWWSVGSTVAILFLVLPAAFKLRGAAPVPSKADAHWPVRILAALDRYPEQLFFFVPAFLLTVLLGLEMRRGMVTVAWALEAVAVFIFALWVGQRSFRLTGLGLLLLCVGKIVVVDIWGLTPRDRYLTFIVLGALLLFVSYLYSRYREALRQYL